MGGVRAVAVGRVLESWADGLIDPLEPYCDDGEDWLGLGGCAGEWSGHAGSGLALGEIRRQCRLLATENEFAINGHENRVSFVVGAGHVYGATARKGAQPADDVVAEVQSVLDFFVLQNRWHSRQQELVLRRDRDGEAFLRLFEMSDGTLRVRFVEPEQVYTPPEFAGRVGVSLGVVSEPDDVESVVGYFVDGVLVESSEIQHRKSNVDSNAARGRPLFYPVRKNLRRAEKLLRNMSVVAEVQSAIALIRKHPHSALGAVEGFVAGQADWSATSPVTGRTSTYRRYGPGTILDAPQGVEYDFPAASVDAGNFVKVLQAELRAIASRLCMPEFMLTSDASSANYASTMVAEGPAVRMFERLQAEQVAGDLEILWRAVGAAVRVGRLPHDVGRLVEIRASAPALAVRDQLKETHRRKIEFDAGVLSRQTWSGLSGLDYDQEQANRGADVGLVAEVA